MPSVTELRQRALGTVSNNVDEKAQALSSIVEQTKAGRQERNNLNPKQDITGQDALDILEVAAITEENSLSKGVDYKPSRAIDDLRQRALSKQDVLDTSIDVFTEHQDSLLQVSEAGIKEADVNTLATAVSGYQNIRRSAEGDKFFSNPDTSIKSRKNRTISKQGESYLDKLANGTFTEQDYQNAQSEFKRILLTDTTKPQQLSTLGVLTPEQDAARKEGAFEQMMWDIMFLPKLVQGWFDKDSKSEWEAYGALIQDKANRDKFYADGRMGGHVVAFYTDPLNVIPVEKALTVPAKFLIGAAKELKFVKFLGEKLSEPAAVAVAKLSDSSLVTFLKKLRVSDEQLAKQIIEESSTRSGKLSRAINEAASRLDEEVLEVTSKLKQRVSPANELVSQAINSQDDVAFDYVKSGLLNQDETISEVIEQATGVRASFSALTLDPKYYPKETRGSNVFYHGTSKKIENLSDVFYEDRNIFGQGFYATEAFDISMGYTAKGKGKVPTIYKITEKKPIKFYNMEAPITKEIKSKLDEVFGEYPEVYQNAKNLREVYNEFRAESSYNNISTDSVQEYFNAFRGELESLGYEGFTHIGGVDKNPHTVKIYWYPESQISIGELPKEIKVLPEGILTPKRSETALTTELNNSASLREVAKEIQYDVLQQMQKTTIEDIHHLGIDSNRELYIGIDAKDWRGQRRGAVVRKVLPPSFRYTGSPLRDLVERTTGDIYQAAKFRSGFDKLHKSIWKGLSDQEHKALSDAVNLSNELGEWFVPVEGGLLVPSTGRTLDMSSTAASKYLRRKTLMQHSKTLVNAEEVKEANRLGFRLYNDALVRDIKNVPEEALFVDHLGNAIERPESFKGLKTYQIIEENAIGDIPKYHVLPEDTLVSELPPTYDLVGGTDGYMRIEYTDKYAITAIKRNKNDTITNVARTHTAPTLEDAKKFIAKNNGKDGYELHATKFNEDTTDLIYDKAMMTRVKHMSHAELVEFQDYLRQANVPEEEINAFEVMWSKFSRAKASPLRGRTEQRLESVLEEGRVAPMAEPELADARYLDWVADYTAKHDTNSQLAEAFWNEYGRYINTKIPGDIFGKPLDNIDIGLKNEIIGYQNQLKQIFGRKTYDEVLVDGVRDYHISKLQNNKYKSVRVAGEILDDFSPTLRGATQFAKGLTATEMIGSFALVQLPLQFSGAFINTNGALLGKLAFTSNRLHTAKLLAQLQTDFTSWLLPNTFKQFSFTKGGRETFDFVRRLGITETFDYAELAQVATNVRNLRQVSRGGLDTLQKAKKAGGQLVNIGASPLRMGEMLGQVYGALAARRILEGEVKAGTHAFLTASDLANGYSDQFLQEALSLGKTYALNMTKLNRPEALQTAIGGTLGLFKEFGIQAGGTLFGTSSRLTKAEQWGMRLAWASLFGVKGVPYAWDALIMAEGVENTAKEWVGKLPDATGKYTYALPLYGAQWASKLLRDAGIKVDSSFIFNWATEGIDAALTDRQIALGSRAALGAFFSQSLSGPNLDEAVFGPVWSAFKKTIGAERDAVEVMVKSIIEDGEVTSNTLRSAGRHLVKPFSGIRSLVTTAEALSEGQLRGTKRNRLIANDPTLTELLMNAASITSGKVIGEYEFSKFQQAQKEIVKEWIYKRSDFIAQTAIDNPELAQKIAEEARQEIAESNLGPEVMKAFIMAVTLSEINSDIPIRDQKQMRNLKDTAVNKELRDLLIGEE